MKKQTPKKIQQTMVLALSLGFLDHLPLWIYRSAELPQTVGPLETSSFTCSINFLPR